MIFTPYKLLRSVYINFNMFICVHRRKSESGATGQGIYITKIVNISLNSIKHKTEGTY